MNIAEKWNDYKTWKKAKIKEFNEKHPKLSSAIIKTQAVIGVGLIFGVTYAAGYNNGQKDLVNNIKAEYDKRYGRNDSSESVSYDSFNKEFNNPYTKGWKEDYRENYNKVCDFANTLDLVKGEEFVISDTKQFENESWFEGDASKPVVSHMINGDGCYPPEED